jgi:hypothetical protein
MGYKIIMNPPMVTNQPNGLQHYHEPTHGYKSTQRVTKWSWTHSWLQMNPTGYKIIDELESKQASTRHNNKFKIMSHMLWRCKLGRGGGLMMRSLGSDFFYQKEMIWAPAMNEWMHSHWLEDLKNPEPQVGMLDYNAWLSSLVL